MKIPQTTTNVGAYYGNEENGQWQPNGVIIDSGVGGGVVGSGDAGVHRPPVYPLHIPRGHIPAGYVMAGAFYPPAAPYAVAAPQDDFEDYMWMENEEEFDKQVMQQLEEEALMEQCIEAMLEDEQRERRAPSNGHAHYPTTSNGAGLSLEETVSRSTLNPLAAEFVPTARLQPPPVEERTEPTESPPAEAESPPVPPPTAGPPSGETQADTHPPVEPTQETPEVSAADIQIDKDKRPKEKDAKKDTKPKVEVKKTPKQESKVKAKPQAVKSEPKVAPKKKEAPKSVKSEPKMEEKEEAPVTEAVKPQQTPTEETPQPGFKPINYAAAARANKPKKPPTPPAETTPSTKIERDKKPEKKTEKPTPKPEKVTQRKNSAK